MRAVRWIKRVSIETIRFSCDFEQEYEYRSAEYEYEESVARTLTFERGATITEYVKQILFTDLE